MKDETITGNLELHGLAASIKEDRGATGAAIIVITSNDHGDGSETTVIDLGASGIPPSKMRELACYLIHASFVKDE